MTRKSLQLILFALLLSWQTVRAQDEKSPSLRFLALDDGFHLYSSARVNQPYIRGDLPASGLASEGIRGQLGARFAGVKAENIFFQHRLGLSVGLRYTALFSSISRNSFFPGHFYLLHRQEGTTTEYLRLRVLEENLHCVGIPLEARFYINPKRRWFLIAGGEASYRVARKVRVEFRDPDMKIYTEDVKSLLRGTSSYFTSFYMGAGVRLGRKRPRWALEFDVPLAITSSISSLNKPLGGGAGFRIQYVLSKSHGWYESE